MRSLTKEEVAAMWLYADEYGKSTLSAIDFWKQLDESRKRTVRAFLKELKRAKP